LLDPSSSDLDDLGVEVGEKGRGAMRS